MLRSTRARACLPFLLAACGGPAATGGGATREPVCRVALVPAPGPATPRPTTRAVTHVVLPLAQLGRELEARVPKRIAEERDRDIGMAGRLQITVDRGPLALTVESERLLVRAPLRARVDACAKGRCYASCEPEAMATVAVPLRLTPDFAFPPSRAEVAITRGCQVKALGGLLRVDVTPMVESAARAQMRRVEQDVDARLPKLRPQAERLWRTLEAPLPLPAFCVEARPAALVQGPSTAADGVIRLRFALAASPEVRARCGAPAAARPLPPLVQDAALPAEDDLDVALVSSTSTGVLVRGVDCGDGVRAIASAAWADDGRGVRLEGAKVEGAGDEVATRLARDARLTPLLAPEGLREAIPLLAGALGDASVDVRPRVTRVTPTTATLRDPEELAATVRVRGAVEIVPR